MERVTGEVPFCIRWLGKASLSGSFEQTLNRTEKSPMVVALGKDNLGQRKSRF